MLTRCHFGQNRSQNATSGWEFTHKGENYMFNNGFKTKDAENLNKVREATREHPAWIHMFEVPASGLIEIRQKADK